MGKAAPSATRIKKMLNRSVFVLKVWGYVIDKRIASAPLHQEYTMRCVQKIVNVFDAIHLTTEPYGTNFARSATPAQPARDIGMYKNGFPKRIVAIS